MDLSLNSAFNKKDFSSVIAKGSYVSLSYGSLWFLLRYSDYWNSTGKLGLVISTKAGNAVVRNRIARQLRAHFLYGFLPMDSALIVRVTTRHDKHGLSVKEFMELDKSFRDKGWLVDQ